MRTSHKRTHTQLPAWLSNGWVRLLVIGLFLGGLAFVLVVRTGLWTAKADELEVARVQLEKAQADFRTNPTKETAASVQTAMAVYRTALGVTPAGPAQANPTPLELKAVGYAVSPKLSDIAPPAPSLSAAKIGSIKKNAENELPIRNRVPNPPASVDPVIQSGIIPGQNLVTNPLLSFDGLDADNHQTVFGFRVTPPDTNADVGPNHVVETVNSMFRVYDKATGTPLTALAPLSSLFAVLGPPFNDINDGNDGDPIVLYDPLADRWLISQFEILDTAGNGRQQCFQLIAISQTADPTGAYFTYAFFVPPGRVNDYPHFGVWPDAYYMTDNGFNPAFTAFLGGGAYAFNRAKMLAGDPTANGVFFNIPTSGGMLPTDIDGVVPPPVGTPNLVIEFRADEFGDPADALRIFEYRPNFTTPASSTLTQRPDLLVAPFDARSPSTPPIEQPSPGEVLDGLNDRMMHRLAYRTLPGGVQSYVLNFTVNVSGVNPTSAATYQAGVRWTELRRNAGTGAVTVNQQATYAPGPIDGATGRNLWMASVAQDAEGNIGLAASATSTTLNPTAIYTGRLVGDPANTLPQGEVDALAAVPRGIQLSNTFNRWGDYSSLSVDPSDECTFWAAMEYVDTPNAAFDWDTRIFSFKVNPNCVTPAKGTIQGQATNSSLGGIPISGVSVTTPEGFFRSTNAAGNYSMSVAPGTYTVTCSKQGFSSASGTVTVAGGGTATFNCALQGVPIINLASSAITAEDCNADGKADPGENITVQVCLNNTGGANPTNLVATLAATGGVTNPSAPQSYGAIPAGGAAVCRNFSFRVSPTLVCGSNVVATFTLADGTNNLGTFTITFQSGTLVTTFAQNFDGVTPPALPSGWTTSTAGSGVNWVTSTTTPDTAPNAAFTPGQAASGEASLVSPAIPINSSAAKLSFRHNFNLESGFDGGVLEVKVGAGAFTDILTAGGSFAVGGYTTTLANFSGCSATPNPLALRQAWSGSSGAYITTTVNLPASLNGQTVQFRWRAGFDCSVTPTGSGWFVDTILLQGDLTCCTKITPTATLADPLVCTGPGNNVAGTVTATNPTASALNGGNITVALPPGLIGVNGCTANFGTCTTTATAVNWTGSLPANSTLIINYLVQVGEVPPATQLCVTVSGGFTGVGLTTVQACVTANCQGPGPGGIIPTRAAAGVAFPPSDQKPGSVLIYPVYSSGSDPIRENTRVSITNVDPVRQAFIHLYFIDGTTCSVADAFICLTGNQTATFLASDLDPGTTGYIVAVAVNRDGCPINFNALIGDEYVKFQSGHAGNLGAESIPAVAGGFVPCTGSTVVLPFDGVAYAPLPRTVALDNVPSRADGNDTLLVLDRIGGDLLTTASPLTNLFGLLYNDVEVSLSFSLKPNTCQFRSSVTNNFPRTSPRFDQFVGAGHSAWFKISSTDDIAIIGASFNLNTNSSASANAFNGGHNLHILTTTTSASYTLPVLPVSCQ